MTLGPLNGFQRNAFSISNSLLSCKEADGAFAAILERQCIWFQPQGWFFNRNATNANIGFATGAQFAIAPDWSVGFGFGYEAGSFDTDAGADGNFHRFQDGAAIKYQKDALLLAASLSGGLSENELTRAVTKGGPSLFPQPEPDVGFATLQSRFDYLFETEVVSLKPTLDLSATHLDLDGVVETGGGAANLITSGERDFIFAASPPLELSRDFTFDNGIEVRTFADLGLTIFADTTHAQTASFASAPDGRRHLCCLDHLSARTAPHLRMELSLNGFTNAFNMVRLP